MYSTWRQEKLKAVSDDEQDHFSRLISEKITSYQQSPLLPIHDHLLKIFFDLAQQYDSLDSFYQICVTIPQALHPNMTVCLAVRTPRHHTFQFAYGSHDQAHIPDQLLAGLADMGREASYKFENILVFPVFARPIHHGIKPDNQPPLAQEPPPTFGALCINDNGVLTDVDQLFLIKLATRIGYNLQRRLLQADLLEHINFLKQLGRDIGHNVITPNMHFKYLFKQLEKKISQIDTEAQKTIGYADEQAKKIIYRCAEIRDDLTATHEELLSHYNRTSLYLETLLRQEHFNKGKFVLKTRRVRIEEEIIIPEIEIYKKRLAQRQITINHPQNMQGRHFTLKGDLGLLSQVFDNLFSNAVKYTTTTTDSHGNPRKAIAYGCRDIDNFPAQGRKGVKFNLFSTGEHLSEEEQLTIFNDGVRGNNVGHNPGSGHGLAFVRNIIEIHGGRVGYEAVPGGNNFYFLLPLADEQKMAP